MTWQHSIAVGSSNIAFARLIVASCALVALGAAEATGSVPGSPIGPVPGQGTWETTLQPRQVNGQIVAYYDTDLNITWLRNANANGQMSWTNATTWVSNLVVGGYSGWRLPISDTCLAVNPPDSCTGSEMGHLWNITLGNRASDNSLYTYGLTNAGGFQNLMNDGYAYWSGTSVAQDTSYAWVFAMYSGGQASTVKYSPYLHAMAVHSGDILAVPEPQSVAMLILGLLVTAPIVRKRCVK